MNGEVKIVPGGKDLLEPQLDIAVSTGTGSRWLTRRTMYDIRDKLPDFELLRDGIAM